MQQVGVQQQHDLTTPDRKYTATYHDTALQQQHPTQLNDDGKVELVEPAKKKDEAQKVV